MKKQIITSVLLMGALTTFAQFTLVKKFDKPIRFIESTQQGLVVATDSSYYIQQEPSFQNWSKYSLNDRILDMDSKGSYVYFATPKRIYEHLTAPIKIQELTNSYFSSIDIYKGKKLVTVNSPTTPTSPNSYTTFSTFTTPFGSFDTLYNDKIYTSYYINNISSDDSLAFIGFVDGGYIYNEKLKKWQALPPLERDVVYNSYVKNATIMVRYSKAGTDFYISHDYGKTYKTKTDAFPFNSAPGSVMEYYNGNAFIGFDNHFLEGILQSTDDGQTWTKILADSSITGLATKGNELFATTVNGSLLKTTITPIVTSINQEEDNLTKLYYSNRSLYNQTAANVEYVIHDLTGKNIMRGTIAPNNQVLTNLTEGVYMVEYQNNSNTKREKIYAW